MKIVDRPTHEIGVVLSQQQLCPVVARLLRVSLVGDVVAEVRLLCSVTRLDTLDNLDTLGSLGSLDNGGNGKYVTCCSCGTTTAGKPSDRPADSEPRLAARVGRSWAAVW